MGNFKKRAFGALWAVPAMLLGLGFLQLAAVASIAGAGDMGGVGGRALPSMSLSK